MKEIYYIAMTMMLVGGMNAEVPNGNDKSGPICEDSLAVLNAMHQRLLDSVNLSKYYISYCGPLSVDSTNKRFLTWNPAMDGMWVIRKPIKDNGIKFIDPASEIARVILYKSNPSDAIQIKISGAVTWIKIIFNANATISAESKDNIIADLTKEMKTKEVDPHASEPATNK